VFESRITAVFSLPPKILTGGNLDIEAGRRLLNQYSTIASAGEHAEIIAGTLDNVGGALTTGPPRAAPEYRTVLLMVPIEVPCQLYLPLQRRSRPPRSSPLEALKRYTMFVGLVGDVTTQYRYRRSVRQPSSRRWQLPIQVAATQ